MGRLNGKVAVVTGGSRGIGRGIVGALAAEGASMWAVARDEARLKALEGEVPGVNTRAADIADPEAAASILAEARPDILVLNAGRQPHMAPVHEMSWEQFSAVWDTDVRAAFQFGKVALTQPLAPGSLVIVVSSGAAINGSPLSGGYAGAKRMQWFLANYFQGESAALERGVRFVALLPKQLVGSTELGAAAAAAYAARAGVSGEEFLKRFGTPLTPEGVGEAVLALALDDAYREGVVFGVTGEGLERMD